MLSIIVALVSLQAFGFDPASVEGVYRVDTDRDNIHFTYILQVEDVYLDDSEYEQYSVGIRGGSTTTYEMRELYEMENRTKLDLAFTKYVFLKNKANGIVYYCDNLFFSSEIRTKRDLYNKCGGNRNGRFTVPNQSGGREDYFDTRGRMKFVIHDTGSILLIPFPVKDTYTFMQKLNF